MQLLIPTDQANTPFAMLHRLPALPRVCRTTAMASIGRTAGRPNCLPTLSLIAEGTLKQPALDKVSKTTRAGSWAQQASSRILLAGTRQPTVLPLTCFFGSTAAFHPALPA